MPGNFKHFGEYFVGYSSQLINFANAMPKLKDLFYITDFLLKDVRRNIKNRDSYPVTI
jgi:hypothetical protein